MINFYMYVVASLFILGCSKLSWGFKIVTDPHFFISIIIFVYVHQEQHGSWKKLESICELIIYLNNFVNLENYSYIQHIHMSASIIFTKIWVEVLETIEHLNSWVMKNPLNLSSVQLFYMYIDFLSYLLGEDKL